MEEEEENVKEEKEKGKTSFYLIDGGFLQMVVSIKWKMMTCI